MVILAVFFAAACVAMPSVANKMAQDRMFFFVMIVIFQLVMFFLLHPVILLEKESCQTVDISSEAGLIGQDPVEPTQMLSSDAHHHAYIHHGEEGSDAYDIPLPSTEEHKAEDDSQDYQ